MITYQPNEGIWTKNSESLNMYVGEDIDQLALVLAQLYFEEIPYQQAYIKLLKMVKEYEM